MEQFTLVVQKKKPKKNAKEYRIETVEEFFNILDKENAKRLFRDFKQCMELGLATRGLTKTIATVNDLDPESGNLSMKAFIWIDD